MSLLLLLRGSVAATVPAGGYDDEKKKRKRVIVDGKSYRVTPYELDQLLELKRREQNEATEAAKEATAIAIAFAKAKPAKQITKPQKVLIEYDDDADIEELLMML